MEPEYVEQLDYEEEMKLTPDPNNNRMVRFRGVVGPNANQEKVKRQRAAKCDICLQEFNRPRQHSIQEHLPFYVTPTTACWVCGTQELTNNFLTRHISRVHPTNLSGATFQRRQEQYVQLMNGLFIELADILGLVSRKVCWTR